MNNPLKKYIHIIKTGEKTEVKEAQKQIKKYWHDIYIPKREEGRKAFLVFLDEIKNFDKIKDVDCQAKLISVLKWPFWVVGTEYFDECAGFILKYIQHESGKIRQAILHLSEYLIMELVLETRHAKDTKLDTKLKEQVGKSQERFVWLVDSVKELLEKYYEPKYRRYKYINSLPPSIYKSLQMLLIEKLFRSEYYENIYNEYMVNSVKRERISDYYYDAMEALTMKDYSYAVKLLEEATKVDRNYVEAYVGLAITYEKQEDKKTAKKYADIAFDKTRKIFPKWPEVMHWGVIENRQYMRAIHLKACLDLEILNNKKQAEELYRLLLKMNPGDNQGIRFLLAGLYVGLSGEDIDRMTDEGNEKQNWDELDNLLEEQNKIHKFWQPPKFD